MSHTIIDKQPVWCVQQSLHAICCAYSTTESTFEQKLKMLTLFHKKL